MQTENLSQLCYTSRKTTGSFEILINIHSIRLLYQKNDWMTFQFKHLLHWHWQNHCSIPTNVNRWIFSMYSLENISKWKLIRDLPFSLKERLFSKEKSMWRGLFIYMNSRHNISIPYLPEILAWQWEPFTSPMLTSIWLTSNVNILLRIDSKMRQRKISREGISFMINPSANSRWIEKWLNICTTLDLLQHRWWMMS